MNWDIINNINKHNSVYINSISRNYSTNLQNIMSFDDRKIAIWKLIPHKEVLRRLKSFDDPAYKCNFSFSGSYINNKITVVEHSVTESTPNIALRDLINITGIQLTDIVTLTELQYSDVKVILNFK